MSLNRSLRVVLVAAKDSPQEAIRRAHWLAESGHEAIVFLRREEKLGALPGIEVIPVSSSPKQLVAEIFRRYTSRPIDLVDIGDPGSVHALAPFLDEFSVASLQVPGPLGNVERAYAEAIVNEVDRCRSRILEGALLCPPKVSVVIPAYNLEPYIAEAVQSAQRQSIAPYEIIVSDDGSSDGTAWRAEQAGATVIRGNRSNGSAARNRGALAASGELLLFLDGDDWWHPHKVELHLAAHQAHPGASFVYDGARVVEKRGIVRGIMGDFGPRDASWRHFLDWRSWTSGSSFSVRRDRYFDVGGFNESLISLQDVDFWVRSAHTHGNAWRLPTPLTFYRMLPRSVSKTPRDVRHNLNRALSGWPFLSETEREAFSRQVFLTAARWCDWKSGRQYLREAGWPINSAKFWKVVLRMTFNTIR